jgi:CRP-like cAMP-binding protein
MKNLPCDLSSCFLCRSCNPDWIELIALKKKTLSYKKGEAIFKEGEKVDGIFFLYSGAAKVHKQWNDEKELILRFATAGEILGHRGIGAGGLYPVSATALVDSEACFISSSFLDASLAVNHSLTYKLMQFYAAELQNAEMRMRNLAAMEVKSRIAGALIEMQQIFGIDEHGYIAVPVSRQDIAAYAGTTYETVFKCLREFSRARTIASSAKSIRINQIDKLKKINQPSKK